MEKIKRIVVTGPESTGKTNISAYLAEKFECEWIPEYARTYINSIKRKYNYYDIEVVGRKQIEEYHFFSARAKKLLIFDTWLEITRIWFEIVYREYPRWIEKALRELKVDYYLLCRPDIEWYPDNTRENGGDMREKLFNLYEVEIKKLNVPYNIVEGNGQSRFEMAEFHLLEYLKS